MHDEEEDTFDFLESKYIFLDLLESKYCFLFFRIISASSDNLKVYNTYIM